MGLTSPICFSSIAESIHPQTIHQQAGDDDAVASGENDALVPPSYSWETMSTKDPSPNKPYTLLEISH